MRARRITEYKTKQLQAIKGKKSMHKLRRRVLDEVVNQFTFCDTITNLPYLDCDDTFHIIASGVEMMAYTFLPGGVLLKDRKGVQIIFYWDILTDRLAHKY